MKKTLNKVKNSKVIKNSFWMTLLQFANTVIPLLTIPYITRILGTNEYGLFSVALNWILYLQVLVEFGFGLSGSRKVVLLGDNKKELNKLYNSIISSRILLSICSFIILSIISIILKLEYKIYICLLILFIMILGTTFQLTWLFQGKQDMKYITIINVISRLISLMLIFIFIKSSNDIYLYCFLYSVTLLISSIVSNIIAMKKYDLKFKFSNFDDIKDEISDGKSLFASSAMTKIFSGFGITVLGFYSTNSIIGIYSAIYKIPYVLTIFFSAISQAIYPYNSSKYKVSISDGINSIKRLCIPIFSFFLIISLIIIFLRNIIINCLFGEEYLHYSIIIVPLIFQFLFAIINNFLGIQILVASGNSKEYSKAFIIGCITIVLLNLIMGKLYEIYGVAIAAFLGELVLTASLFYEILKIRRREK